MLKFTSDLLLFECLTSGDSYDKDQAIEISAILIDKNNYLEKTFFSSPIKTSLLDSVLRKHADATGRSLGEFQKSGRPLVVLKDFSDMFNDELILVSYNIKSYINLLKAYNKIAKPEFIQTKNYFNLWSIGYMYSRMVGIKKQPSLQTLSELLNLPEPNTSQTLHTLRFQAAIFEKLVQKIINY